MSPPKLKQSTRVEELFNVGKLDETLELLEDVNQFEGIDFRQKRYFQFLKGLILLYQWKTEEVINHGEEIFKEGQDLNDNLQSFDGLFFIISGLSQAFKFDEALKLVEKMETLLKHISNISTNKLIQNQVRLKILKVWINLYIGKIDLVKEGLEWCLASERELGNTFEIVWAHLLLAQVMLRVESRYDLAMEYTNGALSLAKEIKFNHFWIGLSHLQLGVIYYAIGELDIALNHNMKSLEIFKIIKCDFYIANLLSNIGEIYSDKGDYDLAFEYLEEGLLLFNQIPIEIEGNLDILVLVALRKGDIELAQKYFDRLEKKFNQTKKKRTEFFYKYSKALMLKWSSRIRDKAKAEKLLKQVIETDTYYTEGFDTIIYAYVHLCDLYLSEYSLTNNNEVLEDLNQYITKLLTISENSRSFRVLCETLILQAKLALLNFDVKSARQFLTQAQKVAETYGLKRLAMKVSNEHDELLKQLKMWEKLKVSEASLSERLKLARLNEQMEYMIKTRIGEVPKISDEDPVLLLIVSEGGIPTFSKLFTETLVIEEDLISSFLAAFNTFSAELFSEGLDRASFGDFKVLMKPISTFLVCYLFKGQSFFARKRIQSLVENIGKSEELLEKFNEYYKTNQVIKLEDVPKLNSIIMETFVKKKGI
ncbi:MAG: hypothetical protein JSV62_06625 [Promethearchaeota archaeon]|nr:MAG: hypothetical protein JSV62_06625 [Candidatus Lokiarchaeota archaeon]